MSGHAGFASHGRDVVCAGVSALVLSGAYGVSQHCGARTLVIDDGDGDYHIEVERGGTRAQAVLETVVSGLRAIARSYPGTLKVRTVAGNTMVPSKQRRPVLTTRKR